MEINVDDAIYAIQCLETDLFMLQEGTWEPDFDSCDASLTMIERVKTFLLNIKE